MWTYAAQELVVLGERIFGRIEPVFPGYVRAQHPGGMDEGVVEEQPLAHRLVIERLRLIADRARFLVDEARCRADKTDLGVSLEKGDLLGEPVRIGEIVRVHARDVLVV